jgi:hypothetical protein
MVSWRFRLPPTRIQKTPKRWVPYTERGCGGGGGRGASRAGQKRGEGRPGPGRAGWAARGAPGRLGFVHVCFR